MKKNTLLFFLLLHFMTGSAQQPKKAELVNINGKNLYYEVYGDGEPLLLLHGYSLSSKSWLPYVEDFYEDYEVYLVDLTGHGKSDAFTEDLSIASVGKDVHALIQSWGLEKMKAIGFSFGGDVLFQLALIQPDLLESMVTIGSLGTWDVKNFPEVEAFFSYKNRTQFPWLTASHQNEEQVQVILDQFKNYQIILSEVQLKSIVTPVLLILGDDDFGMPLEEVARVRKNLPNSDLWILPNVAEGAHEGKNKSLFLQITQTFLAQN